MPNPIGYSMFRALYDSANVLLLGYERLKYPIFSELMQQCSQQKQGKFMENLYKNFI